MDPIIEIGQPKKAGGLWSVQARVNLHGAWVVFEVRAPERLAAQALARWQALKNSELGLRVKAAMQPLPALLGTKRGAVGALGADELWSGIRAQAGAALEHPIFQRTARASLLLAPKLGPALGQMPPAALEAAIKALLCITQGDKGLAAAVRTNLERARTGDARARAVNSLLCAAVLCAKDAPGPAQAHRMLAGLLAAGVTVAGALGGEGAARQRLQAVAQAAAKGSRAGLEALGFVGAAEQVLDPSAEQLFQPAAVTALQAAQIEHEAVGALLAPRQATLVAQLTRLARARRGQYRRAA
jgi:hypothetical protein